MTTSGNLIRQRRSKSTQERLCNAFEEKSSLMAERGSSRKSRVLYDTSAEKKAMVPTITYRFVPYVFSFRILYTKCTHFTKKAPARPNGNKRPVSDQLVPLLFKKESFAPSFSIFAVGDAPVKRSPGSVGWSRPYPSHSRESQKQRAENVDSRLRRIRYFQGPRRLEICRGHRRKARR